MTLVERIKHESLKKGLSLTQLEEGSGIGSRTIYRWDKNSPSADKVLAVANFLQVPLYWLLTGEHETTDVFPSIFQKYELLSDIDKEKINHFIEISLIKHVPMERPNTTLAVKESPSPHMDKENTIAILGYVAAGKPIEGISIPLGYTVTPVMADYALIAKGHSMNPVILNGEYVFVKSCSKLHPGDIGIFYLNGDLICKEYHPQPDCLILKSLNSDFTAFQYPLNKQHDFKIQGKVVLTPEQKLRL